jgi:hypothetical protein
MPAEIEGIFIPLFSHSRQGHKNGSVGPSASAGLNGRRPKRDPSFKGK